MFHVIPPNEVIKRLLDQKTMFLKTIRDHLSYIMLFKDFLL